MKLCIQILPTNKSLWHVYAISNKIYVDFLAEDGYGYEYVFLIGKLWIIHLRLILIVSSEVDIAISSLLPYNDQKFITWNFYNHCFKMQQDVATLALGITNLFWFFLFDCCFFGNNWKMYYKKKIIKKPDIFNSI